MQEKPILHIVIFIAKLRIANMLIYNNFPGIYV